MIGISAIGMTTSVGWDAVSACAAIRAGLQRPAPLLHHNVLDSELQETKALIGRPVCGLTEGYTGVARWLTLAAHACNDLARTAPLPPASDDAFWGDSAVCAVLAESDALRYEADEPTAANLKQSLLAPLMDLMAWPISERRRVLVCSGHAGIAQALQSSAPLLAGGKIQRVILVAVDSYVDADSLEWLANDDRLKLDDHPFGLIPGECAACLLLETAQAAARRGGTLAAGLSGSVFVRSTEGFRSGKPMLGQGLRQAVTQALQQAGLASFSGMMLTDINGEPWRSHEFGAVQMALGDKLDGAGTWTFPADSLGETGAASGAVGLCLAATALRRGFAAQGRALALSSSESGHAGCVLLSALA